MKLTIHDPVSSAPPARSLRLAKPTIDLDTAPYAIALLRLSLGLLFLAHGLLKVFTFTLPGTAQFFDSVGLPGFMAAPVALAEIIGGLLLIAGIYTRWVALGLFPILLVATLKVHGANGWLFTNEGGGWEFPALFAIASLVQFLLGDGAYAIGSI
ncbi:Putative oxidoreductase MhqP [Acaryochloris thomasi RCC1774]|uniref:Oxidoreductase MhqP n=1 Tax=Acaryochloris thomasi RCC1774 TaxID=1764569 RepID=A0A2W1JMS2_9CYAN|nr:DoxX family protein [Acaryochloris thomasi]PZD72192.1 Putative oxidoreductase MhqP [Acaryochloris thomasi RCC1774]